MRLLTSYIVLMCCSALLEAQDVQSSPEKPSWEPHAMAYAYFTPDDGFFMIPVAMMENDRWHLELRYNYEDFKTASLWAGPVFGWEGAVSGYVTPMLGVVAGNTIGWGVGVEAEASYGILNVYIENEYVVDVRSSDGTFFYSWTELTGSITDNLRVGAVLQRTRVLHDVEDVSAGPLFGATVYMIDAAVHWLGPGSDYQYWIVTLDIAL